MIYLDVPISSEDKFCIPTLKNFIMNRTSGDYFENILYKIFVSADEKMTVFELSNLLQISLDSVKNAISLFCRLGIAIRQSNGVPTAPIHASWNVSPINNELKKTFAIHRQFMSQSKGMILPTSPVCDQNFALVESSPDEASTNKNSKRVAFLFDSTLAAFLMMGNLSPVRMHQSK